jgi:hypothetical protein
MKRIVVLLTMMALMVVMLAASVTPAFGRPFHAFSCGQPQQGTIVLLPAQAALEESGHCVTPPRNQPSG